MDNAQDYLGGDESESQELRRELDKADNLLLEARSQLENLLIRVDPQAAAARSSAERQNILDAQSKAPPGVVLASTIAYHLNHPEDKL